ncbi:ABC transporter substrate-binding protein [Rhizobium pusense]|uniref:ABC transporter substrate-binding protein n=1 Tax=Agrobacterium pusense TaxID=648995 RepID=UPI0018E4F096|nr:ABC transporter substrate-binding protein [Agrobacterium pusense]MDH0910491.1 ABC transporter substrate-binding protein [Agrobacterium pusense]MDH1098342.1 ABC transporter substrate-binding protein [Agrobacterium pusense]MDH1114504.1 ABC transporter substrate-binding protein [Agrobacterium pusense]MDH2195732.1 ABC transporter substrate-binding protein [Agrobacterium pusense]
MKSIIGAMVAAAMAAGPALGDELVKVGIIGPFSGGFAGSFGEPFRQGVETYVAQHGDPMPGVKVEFIWRDLPATDPAASKVKALELVTKDKVQYIGGFVFTPNAIAAAAVAERAKIPTVIFNASASAVVSKSKYFVRTSNTLPQVTVPTAKSALEKGYKTVITVVSDYSPGHDAESAFKKTFTDGGGQVLESIRMPLSTTDFSAYLQNVALKKPDALFVFLPYGPPTYAFVRGYRDNGLDKAGIAFIGTSETQESDLQSIGDAAIGLETGYFYSAAHDSPENNAFVAKLKELFPNAEANPATVSAYDGTHAIYEMIRATGGKPDADKAIAAIAGKSWESPRGPITIDAQTRDIVQNVYMRKVEKGQDGRLLNKEIKTYEKQPDYGVAR